MKEGFYLFRSCRVEELKQKNRNPEIVYFEKEESIKRGRNA